MSGDKEWITVVQAAELSGYSIRMIQRLLQEGKIEGWRPGRDWFTTLDAVMQYKRTARRGRPRKDDEGA